jgi:hypothetical protein
MFSLIGNTASRLVVDVSSGTLLSDRAGIGNGFIGLLRLNSLHVRGGAKGQTSQNVMIDDLNVENGEWTDPENGTVTSP